MIDETQTNQECNNFFQELEMTFMSLLLDRDFQSTLDNIISKLAGCTEICPCSNHWICEVSWIINSNLVLVQ